MQRYPQPASGGHTSDREHGGRRFSGGHEGRCIFIVNTARGDLVASAALAKALCSGKIAGAGLDTIAPEPVTTENPLLSLPHDRRGDPGGAKRTAAGKYRERVIIKSKTKTPLQLKWKSCEGVFACTATFLSL